MIKNKFKIFDNTMKDNIFIRVSFSHSKGGVNNLQVAEVYQVLTNSEITLKTFTSHKSLALDRAKKYIKKLK